MNETKFLLKLICGKELSTLNISPKVYATLTRSRPGQPCMTDDNEAPAVL